MVNKLAAFARRCRVQRGIPVPAGEGRGFFPNDPLLPHPDGILPLSLVV
jgi:hypothetical protein